MDLPIIFERKLSEELNECFYDYTGDFCKYYIHLFNGEKFDNSLSNLDQSKSIAIINMKNEVNKIIEAWKKYKNEENK